MKPARPDIGQLSRRDQQVLETVAVLGAASAQDVLRECGLDVGLSTIRTFLTRLEERGFVRHSKDAKAHIYRLTPAARRLLVSHSFRNLVSIAGSPASAAAMFLRGTVRDLSLVDVNDLTELLKSLESEVKEK